MAKRKSTRKRLPIPEPDRALIQLGIQLCEQIDAASVPWAKASRLRKPMDRKRDRINDKYYNDKQWGPMPKFERDRFEAIWDDFQKTPTGKAWCREWDAFNRLSDKAHDLAKT